MWITDRIHNFLGGVSQQPDKLKFPNQLKEQVNFHSDPVEGNIKRPPTEHIAKLMDGVVGKIFCHSHVKDDDQAFFTVITNDDINVFGVDGIKKQLTKPDDISYIQTTNPRFDITAATYADYTFLCNKTKTVDIKEDVSIDPYINSGLLFVKTGNPSSDYIVYVNNVQKAIFTTGDEATSYRTNWIANKLEEELRKNLTPAENWNIARRGSVVLVQNLNGEDFELRADDSNGFKSMSVIKNTVSAISDLPKTAPDGFRLKVIGDKENNADDYYIRFETTNKTEGSDTFSVGEWIEAVNVGCKYKLDNTTMPHALLSKPDGTFEFKALDYTNREAGDDDSNPIPSFVGAKINTIFTHKARIGYLANENLILSSSRDIYNFWKESVLAEQDTDRIDTPVTSPRGVGVLRHAVPFDKSLLLFSDNSQFVLEGGNILSEKTASIDLTTGYEASEQVAPVNAGSTLFFAFDKNEHTGIREYFVNQALINDAEDITSYVPTYLPSKVFKMINSTLDNMLGLLFEETPTRFYCYKYYYSNNQKQQSAWGYWEFPDVLEILDAFMIKNEIFFVLQYQDGVYLEKMNLTSGIADIDYIDQTGAQVRFNVLVDRKTKNIQKTYNSTNNLTTFTFPYPSAGEPVLVDARGLELVIQPSGVQRAASNLIVNVQGDYTNEAIIGGIRYIAYFTLPHIYYRQKDSNGNDVALDGSLQLLDIWFNYARTGYFRVEVTPLYQETSVYTFTGKTIGTPSTTLNQTPIVDGEFPVTVLCRSKEVEIKVVNDSYLPSNFISALWNGDYSHTGNL